VKKTLLKTMHKIGGFAPFHWTTRDKLLILMYHRFSREKNPYKTSAAEFREHLEYLKKHCSVLSINEAAEYLQNQKDFPPNSVVITIDDGYADAYDVAFPLLKQFGFPATLYVVTDFLDGTCWIWTDLMRFVLLNTKRQNLKIEFAHNDTVEADLTGETRKMETASRLNMRLKRMPDEQKDSKIKEIAKLLEVEIPPLPIIDYAPVSWRQAHEMDAENLSIESHTKTHPILTNVNQTRINEELSASKERLEKVLGRKIKHFCYPNGNFDESIRNSVEAAGYLSAVTTVFGFNETHANPFTLNRIDAPPAIESFAQSASGFETFKQKIRN
jgi:peptidoglycan/xylan/chitin deacetylase (PgdA/CDA1 family)